MKLDVRNLRLMSKDDFRVLAGIEMGMRNHEYVPFGLVAALSGLSHGRLYKVMVQLGRFKLIAREQKHYDGYRLTYGGYDFLALRAMVKRGTISGIGRRIGVGKESDIYLATNADGEELALKLHRLGRISFRRIKEKRDYLRHRKHGSWLYLSRLAALKEYAFMQALHRHGFVVPQPVDSSRHCVLMKKVDGFPMHVVKHIADPGPVFDRAANILTRLARCGLVHCDFNEFNLMVSDAGIVTLIDFPQMVSVDHPNAASLFERDAKGLRLWFARKYDHDCELPSLAEVLAEGEREMALDAEVEASGFTAKMRGEYEELVTEQVGDGDAAEGGDADADDDADDDADEEEAADSGFVVLSGAGDWSTGDAEHSVVASAAAGGAVEEDEDAVPLAFAVVVPEALRHPGSRERSRVPLWRRVLYGADEDDDAVEEEEEEAGARAGAAAASAAGAAAAAAGSGSDGSSEEEEEEEEAPWLNVDDETLGRVPDGLRTRLHGRGSGRGRRGGAGAVKAAKPARDALTTDAVREKVRRERGKSTRGRGRGGGSAGGKAAKSNFKNRDRRRARQEVKDALA
ncbi:hypothetical protein FNF28_01728 [Cafeteria roenbergensis]|uniref:Serine/threonine-protein kinase RIO2 n=1 Tax=Cafeteria roenbergensis TaxID=33653 RepID=A0A5A8DXJ4_CAFRO|nr:hypothetical protein FNF28_01728 [Cafeteria roenbergensis]